MLRLTLATYLSAEVHQLVQKRLILEKTIHEGYLPPANEVCEVYVFTGVCLSIRRGGGLSRGSLFGGSLSRGVSSQRPLVTVMCRRYTSYWNAFLLPPATKLGQGYIFTSVCDSVHRGVCLSACWDTTLWTRHPPGSRHPPDQTPPLDQAPPDQAPPDQAPPRAGTPRPGTPPDQAPPRPGTPQPGSPPPSAEHAGRYGQRAGGTHPTGMQSCVVIF